MRTVLGIPCAGPVLGSARQRYYLMLDNLPHGWRHERYRSGAAGSVLYIQKTETPEAWAAIKDCRERNIPVVYERDDYCAPWNPEHTRVMNAADAVTTITEGLAEVVRAHTSTPVYAIQAGFEYDIRHSDRAVLRNGIRHVVTFGRNSNASAALPYLRATHCKQTYICKKPIPKVRGAKFVPWGLDTIKRKLCKHDLVVVVHAAGPRKRFKPACRAIDAMALGLPVLVTDNIECRRVMMEAHHPELLIEKPKHARDMVEWLREDARKRVIVNDLYEYAWSRWRHDISACAFVDLFEKLIGEKNGN